jgi:hypothetical protein
MLCAGSAFAQRMPVPIVNYRNIPITSAGAVPVRAEQVKQAIREGASTRGWKIADEPGNKMLATLVVRNKHTVMVEIAYSATRYSLVYRDSVNMKYHAEYSPDPRTPAGRSAGIYAKGRPSIHPAYNDWVRQLKDAIDAELMRPRPAQEKAAGRLYDVDAVPGLNERGKEGYRLWLTKKTPRAFVVASDGRWNATWGTNPPDPNDPRNPAERAMAQCVRAGKPDCKLYAVDDDVVWPR